MESKIRFFVILMFFGLISLNIVDAYQVYLNIYIVDLDTNTAAESDPIELVDHANSPIQWKIAGDGCTSPTGYTNDIANGEYGDGDTISTGSVATLTEGSSCTLYLQVDEVKVGGNYWGSCVTNEAGGGQPDSSLMCTACDNILGACRHHWESYWIATPTNAYSYSEWQAAGSAGDTGVCSVVTNFGRCSHEVQQAVYDTQTTEFFVVFTA